MAESSHTMPASPARSLEMVSTGVSYRYGADSNSTTNSRSTFRAGSCRDSLASLSREAQRQACQNLCSFLLGLSTCLLTVITSATMQSLLGASPAVFLRQAENQRGQIDVKMGVRGLVNYSAMRANAEAAALTAEAEGNYIMSADEVTYLSPRNNYGMLRVFDNPPWRNKSLPRPLRYYIVSQIEAFDSVADARIGLGRSWTRPALGAGECYISESLSNSLEVNKGDTVDIGLPGEFYFNQYFERHSGVEQ